MRILCKGCMQLQFWYFYKLILVRLGPDLAYLNIVNNQQCQAWALGFYIALFDIKGHFVK